MSLRIGIDTGGTFTDLVLCDADTGRFFFHKVSSTPDDPGQALVRGITEIIEQAQIDPGNPKPIELLVHGTTVATNSVIQRRGARVAFITTFGFRDVLHIQRQDRPNMYDLRSRRAEPLVPRYLRFELEERVLYDGTIQKPVDTNQLNDIIEELEKHEIDAVAVGLLHSFSHPEHELSVGSTVTEKLPNVSVCLSHELVQVEGEYERFSTCAMNAFVQPVMAKYLSHVGEGLLNAGITAPLFVMKSNGGVMSATDAGRQSVHTILSGPAGGVVAGRTIADKLDTGNIITADMGGTSFDVAVIHDGEIAFANETEMAGLALKVPMLDIHTVGAGGGSIGWIDDGGALRIGPDSAGAEPGPACYGRGGNRPTVTDANLVLGRLSPDNLLGGGIKVDLDAARRTIADHIAKPLQLSVEKAAEGMIRVVVATMTAAIRKLTVERGYDPRIFTLCPFGGAGPLHGAEIAHEMNVSQVIVPLAPGVTSAVGLLMSDLREDRIRTDVSLLDNIDSYGLQKTICELEKDARNSLTFAPNYPRKTRLRIGMRYHGQGYDIPVEISSDSLTKETMAADFHSAHKTLYGFSRLDQNIELVNIWVSVEVDLGTTELPPISTGNDSPQPATCRPVIFRDEVLETPVFHRAGLGAGNKLQGPAIVEQLDSTTVIWPNQNATIDKMGQLRLESIPKQP